MCALSFECISWARKAPLLLDKLLRCALRYSFAASIVEQWLDSQLAAGDDVGSKRGVRDFRERDGRQALR